MDEIVEHLRDEITFLRERIRQLEAEFVPRSIVVPREYRLTATEAVLFAHLATRDMETKESLMLALYSERAGDPPEIKIIDVLVCKIRKKVSRFGVCIETVWGQGYSLRDRARYLPARENGHG